MPRSSRRKKAVETLMRILRASGDVRKRKVGKVRRAIRAGAYENDLKLQIAIDRMLEEASR
jgi:anti-sigma28 factor (negative regulator of flagellin synthesis)